MCGMATTIKIKITPSFKPTKIRFTITLSLVPLTNKNPINKAISDAGRLIIPPCDLTVVKAFGRTIPPYSKIFSKYPDQPAETVDAATVYSKTNPLATIQARNSPRIAYE